MKNYDRDTGVVLVDKDILVNEETQKYVTESAERMSVTTETLVAFIVESWARRMFPLDAQCSEETNAANPGDGRPRGW